MDAPFVVTEFYDVAPGHEADFYSWAVALIDAVSGDPGHIGGDVRDPEWEHGEWQIVHRWAYPELAQDWELSETRARWLAAAASFVRPLPSRHRPRRAPDAGPAETAPAAAPAGPPTPPPKWKMAVVTLTAVFPPVLLFNVTLIPRLLGLDVVLRTLILCVGVTASVTWIMMPRLMPLFKGWLNPAPKPAPTPRVGGAVGRAAVAGYRSDPGDPFPRFHAAADSIGGGGRAPARRSSTMTLDPYQRRSP